jgi:hypothetical protein
MSNGTFIPKGTGEAGEGSVRVRQRSNRGSLVAAIVIGGVSECVRPRGGDKTVLPPAYVFQVRNRPTTGLDASCLWQDDNGIIVQENTGETICIDNI